MCPAPLQLYGRDLPGLQHGHSHQDEEGRLHPEQHTEHRNAELLHALPGQVLGAIQTLNSVWQHVQPFIQKLEHHSEVCVGPTYVYTIYLLNIFCPSISGQQRQQILSQYIGFLKRLDKSVSSEVRIMKHIAAQDIQEMLCNEFRG